jgi:LEA14-like dessication related protein
MSRQSSVLARAALVLMATALGACASFGVPLEAPKVTVQSVRLDRIQDAQALFGITVELANPNARPLDVEAVDVVVAIEGEVVATAKLVAPVRVPASGTASGELAAQTGVDVLVRAAIAAMRRGETSAPGRAPTLRYAIEGVAVFNGGLTVPFSRSGEIGAQGNR